MSKIIRREYRIVADRWAGYEVQSRKVEKTMFGERTTDWEVPDANTHATLKKAQSYVDTVLCEKVYETGTYPPRSKL